MLQSYMMIVDKITTFFGFLDTETLGGAGFASQRTTSDRLNLDLSSYEGLQLVIREADSEKLQKAYHFGHLLIVVAKQYTLVLKDEVLPSDPETGREQATTSWEYNFAVSIDSTKMPGGIVISVPWSEFHPTYRGKEKKNAGSLNVKSIKRLSFMMRR